jgi:hypothetical protein
MTETATPAPLEGIIIGPEDAAQLVTVETRPIVEVFTTPGLIPVLLTAVRSAAMKGFTPDPTTDKGRKDIAARAFKVAKTKTYLEQMGKEEAARLKALVKPLDEGRKALWDGLEQIQAETRKPLTDWEARVEAIKARLSTMQNLPATLFRATSTEIEAAIVRLDLTSTDTATFDEFAQEAASIILTTKATLAEMRDKAAQAEADARELARLKQEEEARKQAAREEELRKEGEARALAAQQAPAPVPQPLPCDMPMPAPQPPAPVTLPQADALRRGEPLPQSADDLEHRRAFNREALADIHAAMVPHFPTITNLAKEELAKAVLTAIVTGKIRHITITY